MNTELKEKMQKAADDFLQKRQTANGRKETGSYPPLSWFMAGASAMYTELAPLVEWVSVEDRLPEEWERVLTKYESGFIDIVDEWENRFVKDYGITHWRRIEL